MVILKCSYGGNCSQLQYMVICSYDHVLNKIASYRLLVLAKPTGWIMMPIMHYSVQTYIL